MIELNKKYSTKELCAALGVSYDVFKHSKAEYLNQLNAAFEYTVEYKGRGQYYTFTSVLNDFEKPERKNAKEKTDALLLKYISYIIEEEPINTAANEARIALQTDAAGNELFIEIQNLANKHNNPEQYLYRHLLPLDQLAFGRDINEEGLLGRITTKVWCQLTEDNYYVPISQEMIDEYFKLVDEATQEQKDIDSTIYEDYQNGIITREQMILQLGESSFNKYAESKKNFKKKYGFTPVKVPVKELSAWAKEKKQSGGFTEQELRNLVAALNK